MLLFIMSMQLLAGCDYFGEEKRPDLPAQDPVWSNFISAHASGLVSKKAKIRVMFVNDVVDKAMIGKSATSVVSVDPAVDGSLTFISEREIVLVPGTDLTPGHYYRFTLKPKGLNGIPEGIGQYEFLVQVLAQEFEVNVAGLSASPANDKEMVLNGSLVTADVDDADKIEKILAASYMDQPVQLAWQHNADGRHHDFTIAGIQRQSANQSLHLQWDGKYINASTKGERAIEVPALGQFKVTSIEAVREDQQYVRVYFSDNLDARQNLRGLVRLSRDGYNSRVEGNTLKIYPARAFEGDIEVTLDPGIRNTKGARLEQQVRQGVTFVSEKPKVRFVGTGVILPENPVLSIPFEAINARSVRVTAFRIYENNVGQFLQTNKLDGQNELGRVGRYLWRRTIHLSAPEANKWTRYSLDATRLLKDSPGGLFRLTLSITPADSTYTCPGRADTATTTEEALPASDEDLTSREASGWDGIEGYYGENSDASNWSERENPCKSAYFRYAPGVRDARNFLASNIGLLAKGDRRGKYLVVATDLRTSKPLKGVTFSFMNFQNQAITGGSTDASGFAEVPTGSPPFYLLAEKDGQKAYLKLSSGAALPVSHFDVGGEKISAGIKGEIYGERGVWRPGDDIYLTFVLQDKDRSLPANHPVTMELFNPKGQIIQTLTNSTPLDGFYKFAMKTAEDAPTGDWTAKARLGGNTFSKTLKIETVMPNRLKVELDFGKTLLRRADSPLAGKVFGQWLNGATAAGLKADVKVKLTAVPTRFTRYDDFVFDDPAREFSSEPATLFEGELDGDGYGAFRSDINLEHEAPGMLSATFTTRIFEKGGAFSISRSTLGYAPYEHFLGIKLPKGDQSRNMLLTDIDHTVEIASVDADGKPVTLKHVQLTLYKVDWKWWWDKSGDSLAQYASASHSSVVQQGDAVTKDGHGTWKFQVKYPAWGRYLLRACDTEGNHCSGRVFFIDWPGWAGRAQEQGGPGASILSLTSDKAEYNVGETARIQLPEATQGRALVTIENGTGILDQRWIEFAKDKTRFELPIAANMSPNVFVSVTLIQPHAEKKNDRPLRLYGVIPLKVNDDRTLLKPVVSAPVEWAPEADATVEVSEAGGREMTYTLAVVDEGLLGLTGFKTPRLREHFYKREALGVTTWDLFDDVAGAYGAELERLLALGGGDALDTQEVKEDKKRFPPVVKYLGPFRLKAGAKNKHEFRLPQYVGAVRVMLVAGRDGAYGSVDKSVFVRQPLMLLATLPRVIGPDEDLTVPVSLFVMDPAIKVVKLKVVPDDHFQLIGSDTVSVGFDKPDEKLGFLKLKVRPTLGKATLRFSASGNQHSAKAEVHIDVRSANPATARTLRQVIKAGDTWEANVRPHGIAGTNSVTLEASAVPPLNLERRLDFLIRYPHGCVEQVTSSVFPQLYLAQLVKLEEGRKQTVEKNVQAGIDRLRGFQIPSGAFVYWPGGGWNAGSMGAQNAWATNYAGHFLLESERLGYGVSAAMLADWVKYQKSAAQSWSAGSGTSVLDQAYRLYTLALAKQPELGAMNRLREMPNLPSVARWQLAAAYAQAGLNDAANDLLKDDRVRIGDYAAPDNTFGSRLRDTAIVLNSALLLERKDQLKDLVDQVSGELASDNWQSTQSVAYALLAMSKFVGAGDATAFNFERSVGGGAMQAVKSAAPIASSVLKDFPNAGAVVKVKNTSGRTLFGSIVVRGVAKAGEETASSSGLSMSVDYTDADGNALDVSSLRQGADIIAHISVSNGTRTALENLALTQIVPSGWEIHNMRMDGEAAARPALDYQDIRDDRIYRYFGLKAGETKRFSTLLNAAYLGHYYLPSVSVEAMYDASKEARTTGQWVDVVTPGK
jgi:uncharacterized protein YfaS (alpha-2-macroglobulin family)